MASKSDKQTVKLKAPQSKIYFVRHGESTANEQNVYSGNVWDVSLTDFGELGQACTSPLPASGRLQARNGGKAMKAKGLLFDEVIARSRAWFERATC